MPIVPLELKLANIGHCKFYVDTLHTTLNHRELFVMLEYDSSRFLPDQISLHQGKSFWIGLNKQAMGNQFEWLDYFDKVRTFSTTDVSYACTDRCTLHGATTV